MGDLYARIEEDPEAFVTVRFGVTIHHREAGKAEYLSCGKVRFAATQAAAETLARDMLRNHAKVCKLTQAERVTIIEAEDVA